jgi:hypothetical protein
MGVPIRRINFGEKKFPCSMRDGRDSLRDRLCQINNHGKLIVRPGEIFIDVTITSGIRREFRRRLTYDELLAMDRALVLQKDESNDGKSFRKTIGLVVQLERALSCLVRFAIFDLAVTVDKFSNMKLIQSSLALYSRLIRNLAGLYPQTIGFGSDCYPVHPPFLSVAALAYFGAKAQRSPASVLPLVAKLFGPGINADLPDGICDPLCLANRWFWRMLRTRNAGGRGDYVLRTRQGHRLPYDHPFSQKVRRVVKSFNSYNVHFARVA